MLVNTTPGQHRDASGRRKDTPDGYTDLAETQILGSVQQNDASAPLR